MCTIWPHGKGCLNQFLKQLNNVHPSIKITAKWSYGSMSFLDVNVILDAKGPTYNGPVHKTYRHTSIPPSTEIHCSCHPQYCKSTIPYSQALCICRIYSGKEEHLTRVSKLKSQLVNRGYDETRVQCQVDNATNTIRSTALKKKGTDK